MHYVLVAGGNAFYEKLGRAEMAALARATPRPGAEEASPQGGAENRTETAEGEPPVEPEAPPAEEE